MRNFEKNIKYKAGAYQMNPMPDSFDKVMAALEKKKKRRFIFWLWFLVPAILIAGTSVLFIQLATGESLRSTSNTQHNGISSSQKSYEIKNTTKQTISSDKKSSYTVNNSSNEKKNPVSKKEASQNYNIKKHRHNNTAQKNILPTVDNNVAAVTNTTTTFTAQNTNNTNPYLLAQRTKESFIPEYGNFPAKITNTFSLRSNPNFILTPFKYPGIIKSEKYSKFSLGIYSDLGVSKSVFTDNYKDSVSSSYYSARNQTDIFLFSYSAGLQFRYSPIKNLAIETGIGFTHYESNQMVMDANISMSTADLENYPDTALTLFNANAVSKSYSNVYDYISIPLKLYYQNKWKWLGFEAGGGVIFDVPVNTRSYVANENNGYSYLENDVNKSRLNKFGILVSANANVVFHIKQIGIFAGPTFKYRLNSMFDDNYIIRQQNYFIGGQAGIRYHF